MKKSIFSGLVIVLGLILVYLFVCNLKIIVNVVHTSNYVRYKKNEVNKVNTAIARNAVNLRQVGAVPDENTFKIAQVNRDNVFLSVFEKQVGKWTNEVLNNLIQKHHMPKQTKLVKDNIDNFHGHQQHIPISCDEVKLKWMIFQQIGKCTDAWDAKELLSVIMQEILSKPNFYLLTINNRKLQTVELHELLFNNEHQQRLFLNIIAEDFEPGMQLEVEGQSASESSSSEFFDQREGY